MGQHSTADHLSMQLVLGGYPVTGLASGDAITITPEVQTFQMRTGVRGLGSWYKQFNQASTVNVVLEEGSDDNDILYRFYAVDFYTPGGVMFQMSFIDTSGRTRLISTGARIMQLPTVTIGDGVLTRTWPIGTLKFNGPIGGRAPTPLITAAELPELAELPSIRPAV